MSLNRLVDCIKTAKNDLHESHVFLWSVCGFFVNVPQPRFLELGTGFGDYTALMAAAAAEDRINGKMITVDIDGARVRSHAMPRITSANLQDRVEFVVGDDTDPEVIKKVEDFSKEYHVLFIDTSHEIMHTLKELEIYAPYVVNGGYIVFDDSIAYKDVERAILEFITKNFADFILVHEVKNTMGFTIVKRIRKGGKI